MIDLEEQNKDVFRAFLPRPGSIIPPNGRVLSMVISLTTPLYPAMGTEELTAAMIDIAVNGCEEQTIAHDALVERGEKVLKSDV